MAVPGAVLGQGRNSFCRPGVPLGTLGLGPRAVGPGVHCVLRDAADVPPTATPAPQDESPMRAFWPQAQFPPDFRPLDILGSDQHGFPPALCPFRAGLRPPSEVPVLLCPEPFGLGPIMPGAQFRTCGSWARLGAQGQGGLGSACVRGMASSLRPYAQVSRASWCGPVTSVHLPS